MYKQWLAASSLNPANHYEIKWMKIGWKIQLDVGYFVIDGTQITDAAL